MFDDALNKNDLLHGGHSYFVNTDTINFIYCSLGNCMNDSL